MNDHAQFNAVSSLGGGEWTVICRCHWQAIRGTLAEADAAHAEHVQTETERAAQTTPRRIA